MTEVVGILTIEKIDLIPHGLRFDESLNKIKRQSASPRLAFCGDDKCNPTVYQSDLCQIL